MSWTEENEMVGKREGGRGDEGVGGVQRVEVGGKGWVGGLRRVKGHGGDEGTKMAEDGVRWDGWLCGGVGGGGGQFQ